MNEQDRQAIDALFARLAQVERQAPARDPEAEALISRSLEASPGAAYYMAQTIVAQEAGLREAERRVSALESDLAQARAGGGFLSGLFGDERPPTAPRRPVTGPEAAQAPRGEKGGFLAGAAQTAVGVTGGLLLAQAIGGAFAGQAADGGDVHPATGEDDAGLGGGGDWDDFDV